jgi:hypothetical protein
MQRCHPLLLVTPCKFRAVKDVFSPSEANHAVDATPVSSASSSRPSKTIGVKLFSPPPPALNLVSRCQVGEWRAIDFNFIQAWGTSERCHHHQRVLRGTMETSADNFEFDSHSGNRSALLIPTPKLGDWSQMPSDEIVCGVVGQIHAVRSRPFECE